MERNGVEREGPPAEQSASNQQYSNIHQSRAAAPLRPDAWPAGLGLAEAGLAGSGDCPVPFKCGSSTAEQRRPAGASQGSSPAWSTDRIQHCRSTPSPSPHYDLRTDPTDRPACPVPDCSTNGGNRNRQKLQFFADFKIMFYHNNMSDTEFFC
ncbi:hypothetical protein EYF80_013434 [Liparis tanakae]|uniref:Uncharacterized protein n=1 Tax=Liparis tanakae TaxID=230148 RepID=A0A4Z2IFI0_9TELE|nr:hypothetical protein EYF80_013434 [Liparis tanakae]